MKNFALNTILTVLRRATRPEDVFGDDKAMMEDKLKQKYRQLATTTHPDHNLDNPLEADEAFKLLTKWYEIAEQKLAQGSYGHVPTIDIRSKRHHYVSSARPLKGDLCDLYPAYIDQEQVLVKMVRHPRNNDLMQAEANALRRIRKQLAGDPLQAHFPAFVETFRIRDYNGAERRTNVIRFAEDTVTLADVIAAYPEGIDSADMAWMFNRILVALGVAHNAGIVHGAIVPDHVLLRLSDHNGILVDWCYSIESGDKIKAIPPAHKALVAPEILAKRSASSATDIYMAAMCMVQLLGGDVTTKTVPDSVPRPIKALLRTCLLASPHRRANNAWEIFESFGEMLRRLYGPPTFRPFHLKQTT